MGLRRQPRLKCVLPVRVVGTDVEGKCFERLTCTLDISGNGARISGIGVHIERGAILTVYYKFRRASFRVTWVGHPGSRNENQVGVVTTDADAHFWLEIPSEDLCQYIDEYVIRESEQQERVKARREKKFAAIGESISPEEANARLRKETEELLEVAVLLEQGIVDAAALQQFRQALAYVRNTSWILQRSIELQGKPHERLRLLKMLNTERLRIGIAVFNEIAAFIASPKIQLDPNLVQQFASAVQQLFLLMTGNEEQIVTVPANRY